jgi:hypothetical protein
MSAPKQISKPKMGVKSAPKVKSIPVSKTIKKKERNPPYTHVRKVIADDLPNEEAKREYLAILNFLRKGRLNSILGQAEMPVKDSEAGEDLGSSDSEEEDSEEDDESEDESDSE